MDNFTITEDFINNSPIKQFENVLYSKTPFSCHAFSDDKSEMYLYKCLGFCSKKTDKYKILYYKSSDGKKVETCKIIGFNMYSDVDYSSMQLLIETSSGVKIPINSMYLVDMQKPSFGNTVNVED